ncbi:MAG: hypothetical protein FWG84_10315, partial [Bacteroidales bacterium]|nr:hypothetical protein [Bacteroidales bacterium]
MKKIFYAALINVLIALLGIPALQAQTTDGTDFWLTFGVNNSQTYSAATLQIRVVSRDKPTVVQINFTQLGTTVTYPLAPWEVKTHTLSSQEKQAVYNTATGKSNKSIYIHSDYAITAYAINQCQTSTDATNIFPEPALDIEYYHISYTRADSYQDAYAVIATENNTNVYHEGTLLPNMPLNRGDVYFRRDVPDMTGSHILADKPVAFFAMNERVMIPTNYEARDHLFQQLAPVNTWGKNFFVPVTHIGTDRVRIVASQPGTTVTRTGGIHAYAPGGQLGPTYTLNPGPGQYIELEVNLTGKGCYIVADKPIGVCNYLTSYSYAGSVLSDPAQCWLPPTEQMATQALLAQFTIPPYLGYTPLHYALIVTPDATKNNTTVSIGSGTPVPLFGGTWTTNTTTPPGMDPIAFYTFPLTSSSDSYEFSNDAELFALGYGTGYAESYYYLGYASMRKLDAFFTANDVHNQDMDNTLFCENEIIFHAEIAITGAEIVALKWYINNVEHLPAQNQEDWTGTFAAGDYVIKLEIYPDQGDIVVLEGILHIGAHITVAADPPEGGTAEEDGCYQVGETAVVRATPNECWEFVNWTENDIVVPGANENYSFTVTKDRHLVAHFQKINYTVTVTVDPPNSGTVTGDGNKPCGENVSLLATAEDCFDFVAWIEDDKPVTSDNPYEFKLEGDRTLVALFEQRFYDVTVSVDPSGSGTVTGDGKNKPCGENVSLLAIPEECFEFVGWTEGGKPVTTDNPYEFILEEDRDLVANFETTSGDVTLLIEPPGSGTVTGDGKDFPCDEPVTITATPEECYYFVNWTDEDDNEVSPLDEYTFIMNKSVTWTANFAKYYYDVNVTADPQKGGTITGDGKNIECGETITLTVEEDECYTFIGWTEDGDPVSTANPYIFTLEGDRNLVAHFELKLFDVVVSADPPEGGTVGGGETNFPCGEYITVTAAPDPCYYFVNWTEDDKEVSTSTTYSFEVKDHHTLVANFEIYTYNVTVSASPVAGGIVTIISPDDSGTYNCGEDITVSVEIDPCYNFDGWTDNGKPVGNNDPTYTIVGIDEDHVIVAHFTIKTFTVDVSADPPAGGIVSPNGIETYDCGDDVTVTVKVDDCYTFLGWTDNGDDVGDDLSYTITGIDDDHIVIAHFVLKYFDIIISADPPEGGTVDGGELDFPCGEFITVTAEAEECYYFVNWTEDGDEVSKSEEYTFEVKDHHTLVANFAMYYYDVLVSANPVEGGDVDGGGNHIECGTEITVTAEADDCYTFINWTEDGDEVSTNPIYTFDLFEDRDLVANFDIIPYVLNLSANPIEGSVTGAGTYDCGDWVSAEAFPTDCYTFVEWIDGNGNFVSTDNPYKFFILHETTLEAIFAIKEYTVSVSENPAIGGDATIITQPNANNAYDCDTDVTVTADPDPCYNFVNWTEDGNIVSTNPTYTIEEIDADHTLVANFVIKTFTVDVSADPPAGGIVTGTGTYDCGDNVTVTVEVDECYTFLGWTDNGVNVGNNLSYTITDIDDDHTVIAHFEIILYDVILSANPPEPIGGTVSGGGLDIECGTEITIVATPDDCYTFVNWTEG